MNQWLRPSNAYVTNIAVTAKRPKIVNPSTYAPRVRSGVLKIQTEILSFSKADGEFPGFHDEKLKGKRAGQRSSRLSLQYRVIYSVERDVVMVLQRNQYQPLGKQEGGNRQKTRGTNSKSFQSPPRYYHVPRV